MGGFLSPEGGGRVRGGLTFVCYFLKASLIVLENKNARKLKNFKKLFKKKKICVLFNFILIVVMVGVVWDCSTMSSSTWETCILSIIH